MFEQIISKPKMTEKLLRKPPFRYIHDIFTSTMSSTGFAEGLYDEKELDSKAMVEKQDKIDFLSKMVAVCELMMGEKIDVKPTKIVAGLEPDNTNYFLQCLFKAATSGMDSRPAVRRVMGLPDEEEGEEEGGGGEEEARMLAEQQEQAEKQARAEEKKRKIEEKKR